VGGLKHRSEKRSMDYFAGLDMSVRETGLCIRQPTSNYKGTP